MRMAWFPCFAFCIAENAENGRTSVKSQECQVSVFHIPHNENMESRRKKVKWNLARFFLDPHLAQWNAEERGKYVK